MLHQEPTVRAARETTRSAPATRIVVAVDGGWASRRALHQAGLEAERRGADVTVVTVVSTPPAGHDGPELWQATEREAADSAHAVNVAAERDLRHERPSVGVEALVIHAAHELSPIDAGLLVVGRAGAGGQGVFRMGTTSEALLAVLGCPVLVCRDDRLAGRPTDVPLRQPEVVAAVHVETDVPTVLARAVEEAAIRRMPLCVFTHDGAPGVEVGAALAAETAVPWRIVHTAGAQTAEAILRYADPEDLLVLGNRGHGRLAGHVRGSVTRAVLDGMTCDVLLQPVLS